MFAQPLGALLVCQGAAEVHPGRWRDHPDDLRARVAGSLIDPGPSALEPLGLQGSLQQVTLLGSVLGAAPCDSPEDAETVGDMVERGFCDGWDIHYRCGIDIDRTQPGGDSGQRHHVGVSGEGCLDQQLSHR